MGNVLNALQATPAASWLITLPAAPPTYSGAERFAIMNAEEKFRKDSFSAIRTCSLLGLTLTSALWLRGCAFRYVALSAWMTASYILTWGAVYAISMRALPGARHVVWPLFTPFVWAEYVAADGPPALPAVRAPKLRWWGCF